MGKEIKNGSTLKDFLMTLAATTVSIILTFGTSAIIDRKKQNAEKREMVMMIMYDMQTSLEDIGRCDEGIHQFVDLQIDVIAHPQTLEEHYVGFLTNTPILSYTTTTENIFKSNIETISTIGNILFVESVSAFYDKRIKYKEVVNDFNEKAPIAIRDYENLVDFSSTSFPYLSRLYYWSMRRDFEQCKTMMKVSDKDLEAFSKEREKLSKSLPGDTATEETGKVIEERRQLDLRMEKALKEGKNL